MAQKEAGDVLGGLRGDRSGRSPPTFSGGSWPNLGSRVGAAATTTAITAAQRAQRAQLQDPRRGPTDLGRMGDDDYRGPWSRLSTFARSTSEGVTRQTLDEGRPTAR
jgi:hypothetical protein